MAPTMTFHETFGFSDGGEMLLVSTGVYLQVVHEKSAIKLER